MTAGETGAPDRPGSGHRVLDGAYYRALESERPDAIFRDPYARRLAGKRAEDAACRHESTGMDLSDSAARRKLFARYCIRYWW